MAVAAHTPAAAQGGVAGDDQRVVFVGGLHQFRCALLVLFRQQHLEQLHCRGVNLRQGNAAAVQLFDGHPGIEQVAAGAGSRRKAESGHRTGEVFHLEAVSERHGAAVNFALSHGLGHLVQAHVHQFNAAPLHINVKGLEN